MKSNYVIVVAGGTGNRMNNELPKQFIKINGKEIILYAIEAFLYFDPAINIIIAVHKDHVELLNQILHKNNLNDVRVTEGGNTRFDSVKNALSLISDQNAIVGIHDAARPLVSIQTIQNCYMAASEKGNAIPVIPVGESIRENSNCTNKYANRNNFCIIQTPQCFLVSKIKNAFTLPYSENFTDDATVLEAAGEKINLVDGNIENIKITYPKDLIIAKALLENE